MLDSCPFLSSEEVWTCYLLLSSRFSILKINFVNTWSNFKLTEKLQVQYSCLLYPEAVESKLLIWCFSILKYKGILLYNLCNMCINIDILLPSNPHKTGLWKLVNWKLVNWQKKRKEKNLTTALWKKDWLTLKFFKHKEIKEKFTYSYHLIKVTCVLYCLYARLYNFYNKNLLYIKKLLHI